MSEFSFELFHHLLIKDANQSLLQIREPYQLQNRGILVNWISEVIKFYELQICELYSISFKTTELAIKYVDHGLSTLDIRRERLELLGLTSIYLATKLNETFDYKVQEQMQHGNIPIDDIIGLELEIIRSLQWNLFLLTPKLEDSERKIQMVIQYILISENFISLNNFETFLLAYYQCMDSFPQNYELFFNDKTRQKIIQNQLILDQSLRQPEENDVHLDQMNEANTVLQSPDSIHLNSQQEVEPIDLGLAQMSQQQSSDDYQMEQEVQEYSDNQQLAQSQNSSSSEEGLSDSDGIPLQRVRRRIRKQRQLPSTLRK